MLIITEQMEYLEEQSRHNNLVAKGIEESPGKTWAESEEKVKKILIEKLQLQQEVMNERANRTEKPGGDKQRSIVVKLLLYKDR